MRLFINDDFREVFAFLPEGSKVGQTMLSLSEKFGAALEPVMAVSEEIQAQIDKCGVCGYTVKDVISEGASGWEMLCKINILFQGLFGLPFIPDRIVEAFHRCLLIDDNCYDDIF